MRTAPAAGAAAAADEAGLRPPRLAPLVCRGRGGVGRGLRRAPALDADASAPHKDGRPGAAAPPAALRKDGGGGGDAAPPPTRPGRGAPCPAQRWRPARARREAGQSAAALLAVAVETANGGRGWTLAAWHRPAGREPGRGGAPATAPRRDPGGERCGRRARSQVSADRGSLRRPARPHRPWAGTGPAAVPTRVPVGRACSACGRISRGCMDPVGRACIARGRMDPVGRACIPRGCTDPVGRACIARGRSSRGCMDPVGRRYSGACMCQLWVQLPPLGTLPRWGVRVPPWVHGTGRVRMHGLGVCGPPGSCTPRPPCVAPARGCAAWVGRGLRAGDVRGSGCAACITPACCGCGVCRALVWVGASGGTSSCWAGWVAHRANAAPPPDEVTGPGAGHAGGGTPPLQQALTAPGSTLSSCWHCWRPPERCWASCTLGSLC